MEIIKPSDTLLLNIYKNEAIERTFTDRTGQLFKGLTLTDRAVLAHHKIILKETLGKGSYSKVKEGYDFKHSRQIAVKIIDCTKAPKDFKVVVTLVSI